MPDTHHTLQEEATQPSPKHQGGRGTGLWSLLVVFSFILSLGAGWMTLKPVDFGYPFLHSLLHIDVQIKKYGPKNKYRKHFEKTDGTEQKRLFHEIVVAIHGDIDRLNTLTYHAPDGTAIDKLLREPEIIHLQDVKVLLDKFLWACLLLIPITGGLLWYLRHNKIPFPGMGKITKRFMISLVLMTTLIVLIGPTKVFYQLHIWLFPAENQWFFYYYESLMTTLMVAPVIFGPIAVFIVLAALPYAFALLYLSKRLCSDNGSNNTAPSTRKSTVTSTTTTNSTSTSTTT